MEPAITVRRLTKRYPHSHGPAALEDVSLTIPPGTVYGLIGRNGAGKTTFVRICGTQLAATSGEVRVLGLDALHDPRAVRPRIAAVPQESRPVYWVRTWELVYTYLRVRGMDRSVARERTDTILDVLQLNDVRNVQVNRLSGGTRRRAMVAMVLASDAEVVFLDEPTTGLDPIARREVWGAIRGAKLENRTVILTTHYLDEAEELSARLALLEGGHVVLEGTPSDLRAQVPQPFRVTVDSGLGREELEPFGTVSDIEGGHLVFAREKDAQELALLALNRGVRVSLAPISLEDIFLKVVGRPIDADEPALPSEASA